MAMFPLTTAPEDSSGDSPHNPFAEMFGPQQIDSTNRHAIQFCWMSQPKDEEKRR